MRETIHLSSSDCLSTAIVTSLASLLDVDPMAVPVLYESVDLDALETLVASERFEANRTVTVTFRVEDCEVRVASDGMLSVTDEPGSFEPVAPAQPALATPGFEESTTQSEAGQL
jgi:hypothetical protein